MPHETNPTATFPTTGHVRKPVEFRSAAAHGKPNVSLETKSVICPGGPVGGGPITVSGAPNTQGSMFNHTNIAEAKPSKTGKTARDGRQCFVMAMQAAMRMSVSAASPHHC